MPPDTIPTPARALDDANRSPIVEAKRSVCVASVDASDDGVAGSRPYRATADVSAPDPPPPPLGAGDAPLAIDACCCCTKPLSSSSNWLIGPNVAKVEISAK